MVSPSASIRFANADGSRSSRSNERLAIWRVGAIRQPDQRLLLAGFAVAALMLMLGGDGLPNVEWAAQAASVAAPPQ